MDIRSRLSGDNGSKNQNDAHLSHGSSLRRTAISNYAQVPLEGSARFRSREGPSNRRHWRFAGRRKTNLASSEHSEIRTGVEEGFKSTAGAEKCFSLAATIGSLKKRLTEQVPL